MTDFNTLSKYNGWTNYPTWCVYCWLSNTETDYNRVFEIIEEAKKEVVERKDIYGVAPSFEYLAGERLKNEINEFIPLEKASLYLDLLDWAICYIDFKRIIRGFLDE